VLSIIEKAGWSIWPLIFASIIALGIIGERFWSLRGKLAAPRGLLQGVLQELQSKGVTQEMLSRLMQGSPLGRIFSAALRNANSTREIMKESIEEEGRAVAHELERFLTTLGTIATAAPLWGLFGTVRRDASHWRESRRIGAWHFGGALQYCDGSDGGDHLINFLSLFPCQSGCDRRGYGTASD
jgi:hypothetical protein